MERHKVDLGTGYKNNMACSTFVDYIARDLRDALSRTIQKSKFFSIQMDGSTDAANVEEELFLVLYFDPYSSDGLVYLRNVFLCVRQPSSANAEGLYECFGRTLSYMGIDVPHKLVGFGCDGTNVNMGERALKGLLQAHKHWLVVCWCMAHRLELAIKDGLCGTFFSTIDEMLMRAYYLYAKSPKKCRDLEVVVEELKSCLMSSAFPSKGEASLCVPVVHVLLPIRLLHWIIC